MRKLTCAIVCAPRAHAWIAAHALPLPHKQTSICLHACIYSCLFLVEAEWPPWPARGGDVRVGGAASALRAELGAVDGAHDVPHARRDVVEEALALKIDLD